jgi:hypothetical protein
MNLNSLFFSMRRPTAFYDTTMKKRTYVSSSGLLGFGEIEFLVSSAIVAGLNLSDGNSNKPISITP